MLVSLFNYIVVYTKYFKVIETTRMKGARN